MPQLLVTWQLAHIPTAAERLDQVHTCDEPALENVDGRLLVCQQRLLCRHNGSEGHRPSLVLVDGDAHRLARVANSLILQGGLGARRIILVKYPNKYGLHDPGGAYYTPFGTRFSQSSRRV